MGIFDRISRVVRANVNDMIDKAEDPEKVLEQSLREMGDDLGLFQDLQLYQSYH